MLIPLHIQINFDPPPPTPRTVRSPFKRPAPTSSPAPGTRFAFPAGAHARSSSPTSQHIGTFSWSQPVQPSRRVRAPAGLPFKAPERVSSPVGEHSSKKRKGAVKECSTNECVLCSLILAESR